MRSSLRSPRFWLGMAVSVLALVLAVRGVHWSQVRAELTGASYAWLLPASLVFCLGQVARALRWRAMFGRGPRPSRTDAFAILSVGYLVSTLLPLRLGDFVRAWLIGARTPAGATEGLATVMLERVVDLVCVVALVAILVPAPVAGLLVRVLGPGGWAQPALVQAAALLGALALYLVLVVMARAAAPVERQLVRLLSRGGLGTARADRAAAVVGRFLAALGALKRPRTAGSVAAWSVAVWLLGGLQYWLAMRVFHLDQSFAVAMFVLAASALWAILPSSPGYLGVFHHAIRVSLPFVAPSVTVDQALSYAVVLHAMGIVMLVVLGVVGLLMLGVSLPDVLRRSGAGAPPGLGEVS